MVELFKEFLLFGVVEVFIVLMFYKKIGKVVKVRYWHILLLSPIIIFLNILQIPYTKQLSSMIVFVVYLYLINKQSIKNIFKLVILSFLYLLCVEAVLCLFIEFFTTLKIQSIGLFDKFIFMIPMRIVEILIIIIYEKRGKIGWDGFGLTKLKKLKKKK